MTIKQEHNQEAVRQLGAIDLRRTNQQNVCGPKAAKGRRAHLISNSFKDYCSSKGIKLFTTAVGLPRGNGQAERMNKTILDDLAASGSTTEKNNWDSKVQQIQQGINSTKNRITQHSPAELLVGFQLRTDTDLRDIPSETNRL
nr:unnamed protein product [Callosobruchus analis]